MVLDNEQQRAFLLEVIKQSQFPGAILEIAVSVKHALMTATCAEDVQRQQRLYDAKADAQQG